MEKHICACHTTDSKITVTFKHKFNKYLDTKINCNHIKVTSNFVIIYGVDRNPGHDKILPFDELREINIFHHGLEDSP